MHVGVLFTKPVVNLIWLDLDGMSKPSDPLWAVGSSETGESIVSNPLHNELNVPFVA